MKQQFNKYFTFLGLYIAQSIPMSFFTTVIPIIMRQENYSLESIGLLQFVKLPWILKFLWAPIVDKKSNTLQQYKRWIIVSEIFYACIILSIGFFDLQVDFHLIASLIILAIIASATQDIATDALAVLTLKKEQRSAGNAIQSAGGFVGALIGSGLLLLIYNSFGWIALLAGLSGFVLIALIPLKKFNYPIKEKPTGKTISTKEIVRFFTQKGIGKHILFLSLSYSGLSGLMAMTKPYMVDNGYSLEEIGYISGIMGTIAAAIAAILAGFIIKKTGIRKALILFSTLIVLVGIYFLSINISGFNKTEMIIGICSMWAVYAMMNVAIYTLSMNRTRSGLEGTDFTIQTVISQLGSLIVAGLSGIVSQKLTYQGLFITEIILALVTVLYISTWYGHKIEKQQ